MSLFDLLFIVLFLATVATLLATAWFALRGQFPRARRVLLRLIISVCAYMTIVIAVSLISPRRMLQADARQCFDDWCVAVDGVQRSTEEGTVRYSVALRLSSRARRVSQREKNLSVYLTDDRGRRFEPVTGNSAAPFSVLLQPQESVVVNRSFVVPAEAREVGLVITHEGGFPIGWFIIGYDTWFRKPPVVQFR